MPYLGDARQFLERLPRPEVDLVSHLPPAIAIEQRNPVTNARSTVGTATEILDHLRLLYAKVGETRAVPGHVGGRHETVELRGKDASFAITVKEIKRLALPEADDKLAEDVGFESLEELRGRMRESADAAIDSLGELARRQTDALIEAWAQEEEPEQEPQAPEPQP